MPARVLYLLSGVEFPTASRRPRETAWSERTPLPAVRIAHAVGEHAAAHLAADELRATATVVRTDALLAMSAVADAILAPPDKASILLEEAVQRYHRAGLPHHEAEARLTLAESLLATQDVGGSSEQILVANAV